MSEKFPVNAGYVTIPLDHLARLLRFQPGVEVLRVEIDALVEPPELSLVVSGPGLPKIENPGQKLTKCNVFLSPSGGHAYVFPPGVTWSGSVHAPTQTAADASGARLVSD